MKLMIDIPVEFEAEWVADAFESSLNRLRMDAHSLAGKFEQETASMLVKAFKNATPIASTKDDLVAVAIAALRKQLPIKPDRTEDEFKNCYKYRCPVCGYYFGTKGKHSVIIFDMPKYCDCGQAIDWSGE